MSDRLSEEQKGKLATLCRIFGASTVYKMPVRAVAVGEDWDGTFKPLSSLEYAPVEVEADVPLIVAAKRP